MLGVQYLKMPPTTYVAQYKAGRVVAEGPGLSFWYFAPTSEIVLIPLASAGVPFVFNETTADFQEVTVQGEFTYRIVDPKKLSSLLDYSIDPNGRYRTEDPQKLPERLTHVAQRYARGYLQTKKLREALTSVQGLVDELTSQLNAAPAAGELGVEIVGLSIIAVRAEPEMSKAMQAEARERLLREADEAVYERRNNSVLLERTVRENEFKTELLVQQKQREVDESKLAAEIALTETRMTAQIAAETERAKFVEQNAKNQQIEADARAYALKTTIEPIEKLDWRTLMAMNGGGDGNGQAVIAMAFQELAQNAQKIGELTITPELLHGLLRKK
ncbi:MAG: SPFH domain-containing protein [Pirellulales bacterium]